MFFRTKVVLCLSAVIGLQGGGRCDEDDGGAFCSFSILLACAANRVLFFYEGVFVSRELHSHLKKFKTSSWTQTQLVECVVKKVEVHNDRRMGTPLWW